MHLAHELGFDFAFYKNFIAADEMGLTLARVSEQQKNLYRIRGFSEGRTLEWWAEISGKLYFEAADSQSFPTVGDWVLATPGQEQDRLQILRVLPRKSLLERRAIGPGKQSQLLAANIDHIFVVSSLNQDLNLSRLERYRSLVEQVGVGGTLLLTKADLHEDPSQFSSLVPEEMFPNLILSALNGNGLDQLKALLEPQKTYVFIGSSGVGKSTLVNGLMGWEKQHTAGIREEDSRGRHTTSARSLIQLPHGAWVIDTPGIRELGLWQADDAALDAPFASLLALAAHCRYRDCQHQGEPGCAVLAEVAAGRLEERQLSNYRKLQKEQEYFERRGNKQKESEAKNLWKKMSKDMKRMKKNDY